MSTAPTPTETYLGGQWKPVTDELDVAGLEVIGELPDALTGTYYRNGPNPQFDPITDYHLFDGDGMVHSIELGGGSARYRNRWIEGAALLAERAAGRALYGGLAKYAEPPAEVAASSGAFKNTSNTALLAHDGQLLALMEGGAPVALDPDDLSTRGEYTFGGTLPLNMTAHPKVDPHTGEVEGFSYLPFAPHLYVHSASKGKVTRTLAVELPNPVMMHDFVMTERHLVIFDLPARFDYEQWMDGGPSIEWDPSLGARVGVLPRGSTTDCTTWIDIDPCYVFHFMNGWEHHDGHLSVVGCRADAMPTAFGDDTETAADPAVLHRWEIDPARGTVDCTPLGASSSAAGPGLKGDFPVIDPRSAGSAHRFGYLSSTGDWDQVDVHWDRIHKVDLSTGEQWERRFPDGFSGGESQFVNDPGRPNEDGGWLLNLISDHRSGRSELWVLDAEHLDADPVARIVAPRHVPSGFHGTWVPVTT